MKLSTYAILLAIVGFFYGIALLFMPASFLSNYGITANDSTVVMSRFFGSAMLGNAILFWLHRNVPATDKSWSALLGASVIFSVANFVIGLMAVTGGMVNSMGWSTVVISALFAIASGYYASKKAV